jgi:hypothetical protein
MPAVGGHAVAAACFLVNQGRTGEAGSLNILIRVICPPRSDRGSTSVPGGTLRHGPLDKITVYITDHPG